MTSGYGTTFGAIDPRSTEGTLGRRFWAYLIDIVVIAVITCILWVLIGILGVLTLGLAWLLFGLLPFTAIVYNAITISGPSQGTMGMRAAGLRVDRRAGVVHRGGSARAPVLRVPEQRRAPPRGRHPVRLHALGPAHGT